VNGFSVEVLTDGKWKEVAGGSTIGYKRIVRFNPCVSEAIRINIENALACPVISAISAFQIPEIN
jgi:alpha-L-fucosidase